MSVYDKGLITICACCALFTVLSLPLIFRKVPRNPVYGYRIRAVLGDDRLWYDANAFFGKWLFAASFVTAGVAAFLHLWRGFSPDTYLRVSVLLLMTPAVVAIILTGFFVRSRKDGGSPSG